MKCANPRCGHEAHDHQFDYTENFRRACGRHCSCERFADSYEDYLNGCARTGCGHIRADHQYDYKLELLDFCKRCKCKRFEPVKA
jgi:hypothetical protein